MQAPDFYAAFEQMAAGLAHEVRNPLSLVKANIELLELDETAAEIRRRYDVMRRELDRANRALSELMHLAGPTAQKRKREALSLNNLLGGLLDALRLSYGRKATFELTDDGADCIVMADEESLQRMFRNVLKNALESVAEAHADGSGLIRLSLSAQNGFVTITVIDNGRGLTETEATRVTAPFFTTKAEGTGLGLHISRTAAESHGGSLSICGTPDIGCTVTICLPLSS